MMAAEDASRQASGMSGALALFCQEVMTTALHFWRWLMGERGQRQDPVEVSCRELFEAAQEYQVRELSFWVCANMVANALGTGVTLWLSRQLWGGAV